jgi:hypothetical protein
MLLSDWLSVADDDPSAVAHTPRPARMDEKDQRSSPPLTKGKAIHVACRPAR